MLAGRFVDIEPLGGVPEPEGLPDLKPSSLASRMVRPHQTYHLMKVARLSPLSGASHERLGALLLLKSLA
jgi:hypothetical protein